MDYRLVAVAGVAASVLYILFRQPNRNGAPQLPPGPRGLPLIGNLLDFPRMDDDATCTEWAKQYGELVLLQVFGRRILLLNSNRVAVELLVRRGKITSDRASLPMAVDLAKFNFAMVFMNNDERFRIRRRLFEQNFRSSVVETYQGKQIRAVTSLLYKLNETPSDFMEHTKYAMGSLIMDITYGLESKDHDDERIQLSETVTDNMAKAVEPGAWLVDVIPALRYYPEWLPGSEFKRIARGWAEMTRRLVEEPFAEVIERMRMGQSRPCICETMLQESEEGDKIEEKVIKDVTAAAYAGAVGTTFTTLQIFLLQMVLRPEIQKLAQKELDTVCPGRLPGFSDRGNLPYVDSVIRETFRWHPIAPKGVPHRLSQDEVFEGHLLPKDTLLMPNVWGICHDSTIYSSPDVFDPSRYIANGRIRKDVQDPRVLGFGYGRRQCPGMHLAEAFLFITVASILKIFDINPAIDSDGKEVEAQDKYASGMLSAPDSFDCRICLRSSAHGELLKESVDRS